MGEWCLVSYAGHDDKFSDDIIEFVGVIPNGVNDSIKTDD